MLAGGGGKVVPDPMKLQQKMGMALLISCNTFSPENLRCCKDDSRSPRLLDEETKELDDFEYEY
jgi:hypothetical protein